MVAKNLVINGSFMEMKCWAPLRVDMALLQKLFWRNCTGHEHIVKEGHELFLQKMHSYAWKSSIFLQNSPIFFRKTA